MSMKWRGLWVLLCLPLFPLSSPTQVLLKSLSPRPGQIPPAYHGWFCLRMKTDRIKTPMPRCSCSDFQQPLGRAGFLYLQNCTTIPTGLPVSFDHAPHLWKNFAILFHFLWLSFHTACLACNVECVWTMGGAPLASGCHSGVQIEWEQSTFH